jgi:hypothetical protein
MRSMPASAHLGAPSLNRVSVEPCSPRARARIDSHPSRIKSRIPTASRGVAPALTFPRVRCKEVHYGRS